MVPKPTLFLYIEFKLHVFISIKQFLRSSYITHKKKYCGIKAIEKLAKISNDPSGLSGIPSGFHELDQLTSGWQDGDVIVVAGRPSMGKTSFATSILKYIAVGKSTPCVYFCLETKAREVANRLIANYSDIPISGLMSGRLSPGDWEKFDKFTQEISTAPIYLGIFSK